jgi:tetratricopeptide (TPR) repeat protein
MIFAALFLFLSIFPGFLQDDNFEDAVCLYQKGKFNQAADLFRRLKDAYDDKPEIRLWLGKSYIKIREWDDAVREMEEAVELAPGNAKYYLWLGRARGFQAEHSSFIKAPFRARRVLKAFETARDLDPNDVGVRFDLLEYYLHAPGFLGGGKDKAKAEARIISKLNPAKGHMARATIYQKNKDWDRAEKELIQATIDYPGDADAWKDLADYLLDRQDFKGALHNAEKVLEMRIKAKRARLIKAAAEIRLDKNLDHTAGVLQELAAGKLEDESVSFEEVFYWLGECLLAQGHKAEAREAFVTALGFNPDYAKAKDSISRMK